MNKSAGLLEGLWVRPWRSDWPGQFLSVPGELLEFPGLSPPPEDASMPCGQTFPERDDRTNQERLTFISRQCFGKILSHQDSLVL